ncbi:hypothetical protein [Eubacterium xylanophilum]|uniref:hypothetical protein n=1 Tax=Eubacterium xylanophilum TaxID=39497 RepID=UPI00047E835D|nr:hypothetical protein [Eubacterium xylanophilum]
MGNTKTKVYAVIGIIFMMFTVLAFVPPFQKDVVFFVAYIFGIMAILYQIYVFKISFGKSDEPKSYFYGFPIARVGAFFLLLQLVMSLIEMCFATIIPVWIAVIINILLLSFALIGCIASEVMRDEITRQDMKNKSDVSNLRLLQAKSASFVSICRDEDVKRALQSLTDELKYSDPVTSEATKEIETKLISLMDNIQESLEDGDIKSVENFCMLTKACLAERNKLCKYEK